MPSTRLSEGEIVDQLKFAFQNPALVGSTDLVAAPGPGFKIVVYGYCVNGSGGANSFVFTRGAGLTPICGQKGVTSNGAVPMPPSEFPLYDCGENEKLAVGTAAATAVGVDVWYALQRVTP